MAVTQLLHPEADSGPIGHGEEASLKSGFVKTECSCPVYFLSVGEGFPSTDRLLLQLQGSTWHLSSNTEELFTCFGFLSSYNHWLCLFLQSLLLVALLFFFLHESIPIMCQANNTQRIPLHCPSSSSSEVLAVCGVNSTVWCALELTI